MLRLHGSSQPIAPLGVMVIIAAYDDAAFSNSRLGV
jgi:hypothetical protein